jgi:hypothetical protein
MSEPNWSKVLRVRNWVWVVLALCCSCEMMQGKGAYTTDRMVLVDGYQDKAPGSVAILPVEAVDSLDFQERGTLRDDVYNLLLKKGYAPLALPFTDRTLRDLGRSHTPLCQDQSWNVEPLKGVMGDYADALVMICVDRYLESGQPGTAGIQIWGKVGVFDSRSGEMLYEHYTRRTLHPTDPGGGRELYIQKAVEEFAQFLLSGLPEKRR